MQRIPAPPFTGYPPIAAFARFVAIRFAAAMAMMLLVSLIVFTPMELFRATAPSATSPTRRRRGRWSPTRQTVAAKYLTAEDEIDTFREYARITNAAATPAPTASILAQMQTTAGMIGGLVPGLLPTIGTQLSYSVTPLAMIDLLARTVASVDAQERTFWQTDRGGRERVLSGAVDEYPGVQQNVINVGTRRIVEIARGAPDNPAFLARDVSYDSGAAIFGTADARRFVAFHFPSVRYVWKAGDGAWRMEMLWPCMGCEEGRPIDAALAMNCVP